MELTDKELIPKRVSLKQNGTTQILSATSNYQIYDVYAIELHGGGADTHIDIQKTGKSSDYIAKEANVVSNKHVVLPKQLNNIKEPAFRLYGGEGLQGVEDDNAAAVDCTIWFKKTVR